MSEEKSSTRLGRLLRSSKEDRSVGTAAPSHPGKVFSTLTLPNGRRIQTMREDAFRSALAATSRVHTSKGSD